MKPPVTIDKLLEEWSKDSKIDETEPGRELIRIPQLHSKYLNIMTHHNLILKKISNDYNVKKKLKWEYYSGDLNSPEDLEEYGYEPMVKKVLRQDMSLYIDSDKELTDILLKKAVHQEIVDVCQSILKELHSRTFQLRSFIEYEKFIGGA